MFDGGLFDEFMDWWFDGLINNSLIDIPVNAKHG